MSEKLCPGCGSKAAVYEREEYPTRPVMCTECDFEASSIDEWNRREPGPATKAMLKWCQKCQDPAITQLPNPSDIMNAFIAEWKGK